MEFRPWLHVQFSSAQLNEACHNIRKARNLIEVHGWAKDWFRIQAGWLGLPEAINQAAGNWGGPTFHNPAMITEAILTRHLGMNIFTWNDDHARNQEHVIETLDGLIAILTEETQHDPDADPEGKERVKEGAHVRTH